MKLTLLLGFAGLASLGCGSSESHGSGDGGGNVCGDYCAALRADGECSVSDMPICEAACSEARQARSPCLAEDQKFWECAVPFSHCIELADHDPTRTSSLVFDDGFFRQSCQAQIAALDGCLSANGKK